MNDRAEDLLEKILASQVLVLADQIRLKRESKGTRSTDDYTKEAARIIRERQSELLQLLK